MKLKRFVSLVLVVCLLAALVPQICVTANAATNVELTVWIDGQSVDWLNEQLNAFQTAHPEWNLSVNIGQCDVGDAGNMVSADPQAAADVFVYASDQFGALMEAGALMNLTGDARTQVLKDSSDSMLNAITGSDGKIYGVPYASNTFFLYYDKSVFTEADVKSLEAMLSKGRVNVPLTNSWYLASFYFANGCTMFGSSGSDATAGIRFCDDKGVAVTKYLAELVKNENLYTEDGGAWLLQNGTVDAVFSGVWDSSAIQAALGDHYAAAQLPTITINGVKKQLKAFAGCKAFGVNAHTDYPAAAQALAAFLGSEDRQLSRYQAIREIPTIDRLATNAYISGDPAAVAQIDTINNTSVVQPSIPEMAYYWDPANTLGRSLVNGQITDERSAEAYILELNCAMNRGIAVPTQPTTQNKNLGKMATFTVEALGSVKFQWQYKSGPNAAWKNCTAAGSTTNTLKLKATKARDGYQYRCVLTSPDGGFQITDVVKLNVNPVITTQPKNTTVVRGNTATFTVKATGTSLKYQWQYRTGATGTWKNATAAGNKTATLKVPSTGKNGYQYRCKITDGTGNVKYTNAAKLTVTASKALKITAQPTAKNVKSGVTANFTVKATGNNLMYQWQYRTSATGTWKNATATGNKTATLKVAATVGKNGYQYRCKITDASGTIKYTNAVKLTVFGIKTQPTAKSVKAGNTAKFAVTATGSGLKYQWQYRTGVNGTWKSVGAGKCTLSVSATTGKNGYQYRCKITDSLGRVIYTNVVKLTVK